MHVFGLREKYPYAARRSYTPRPAPLADYLKMARTIGLDRMVLVQASAYGADNSCILDAAREIGSAARVIVGIDETTTDSALHEMNGIGAKGVRLNTSSRGLRDPGVVAELVKSTVERIAPLGWHLQLFTDLFVVHELRSLLANLHVPLVLDHMALARGPLGPRQFGFADLLDLLATGRCWVKLSGAYRISDNEPEFEDAAPIARALIAANPERVVWGTDWPHTGKHEHVQESEPPPIKYRPLDDGHLIDLLANWTDNENTLRRILVSNPAELYEF